MAVIDTRQKKNIKKTGRLLGSEKILPPKSISDQIYDLLKKKILNSEVKPGERLMQEELAEALNASRTPIRQAFSLLEKDGLVQRLPQGGFRVTQIDIGIVKEVFGVRGVLEAYAVELACEKIQTRDIQMLRHIEKQAAEIVGSKAISMETKRQKLLGLNSSFHEIIYKSTGSTYLINLINNLKNVVLRLRAMGLRDDKTWKRVWKEHSLLINYLERRDKESAAKLMRDHIYAAASYVLAAFQSERYEDTVK